MSGRFGSDGKLRIDVPAVTVINASGIIALSAGTETASTGTVVFADSNGITWGLSSNTLTASFSGGTGGGGTGPSIAAGTQTATSGTVLFANSNNVTFGMSGSSRVTASYAAQVFGSGSSESFSSLSFGTGNGFTFGLSSGTITGSYTRPVVSNAIQSVGSATGSGTNTSRFAADDHVHAGVFSFGLSTAGNVAGDTRVDVGRFVLQGGNNVTLSQITAANALNTIVVSGAATSAQQTGISGIQVSDNTFTSGTVTLQNANGISFGSSGANGISASYTVPTVTNSSWTAQDQAVALTIANLAFSTNAGITFGLSTTTGGSATVTATYTVPSTAGLISAINVSAGAASNLLSKITFSNANHVSFGLNASTLTASYALDVRAGVATGTAANSLSLLSFADSNGVSFGLSAGTITASVSPSGGAQTGISGIQVSNATFTSGTVTFQNANGISFGSSSTNGVSISHTLQFLSNTSNITSNALNTSAYTLGLYVVGNTSDAGSGSSITVDPRSISFSALAPAILALSSGELALAVLNQLAASIGTGATRTIDGLTMLNSNNVSFGFLPGLSTKRITASYEFDLSAGTTSSGANGLTFSDANGIAWGYDGSNISANPGYLSYYENLPWIVATGTQTHGNSTVGVFPFILPLAGSFSYIRIPNSFSSNSTSQTATTNSSFGNSASVVSTWFAVAYSLGTGASSRSLQFVASGSAGFSQQLSLTLSGTRWSYTNKMTYPQEGATNLTFSYTKAQSSGVIGIFTESPSPVSNFNSLNHLDIPFANSLSAGAYWMVFGRSSTTSTQSTLMSFLTGAHMDHSHICATQGNQAWGLLGNPSSSSNQLQKGIGSYTTNAMTTASIDLSQISSSASHMHPYFQMHREA